MKRPTLRVLEYRHSTTHPWYLDLRPFNRGRKFFKTKAEAEAERLRQITTLERHGREAVGLPPGELSAIIHARKELAKHGKTIGDASAFYLDYLERIRRCSVTVSQLAAEVLDAKRKDGMSATYIDDLKKRLARFCSDFGERKIAGITVEELDNWLRALLNAAAKRVPGVVPMLAIGAFAGLRDAEIKRLDWSEVDQKRGHIEVKARKAKSARRRIVQMQTNLAAWLQPYAGMTGAVAAVNWRKKLDLVRKAAKLERWPQNGLRHSFASYRLAACHDAPRVAGDLGHTSPKMLYSTYRAVVLPEEAERYWKLVPDVKAANVVTFGA